MLACLEKVPTMTPKYPKCLGLSLLQAVPHLATGTHARTLPRGGRDQPGHGPHQRAQDLQAHDQRGVAGVHATDVPPHPQGGGLYTFNPVDPLLHVSARFQPSRI
jgi:hypothetical protein